MCFRNVPLVYGGGEGSKEGIAMSDLEQAIHNVDDYDTYRALYELLDIVANLSYRVAALERRVGPEE